VLSTDAFTIEMPGRVVKQVKRINTALGPAPTVIYSIDLDTESFLIMYQDFPPSQYDFNGAGLEGVKKGYVRFGWTIRGERKISLGDYAGREIVSTDKDGFFYVSRVFSVEPRLYQIVYGTSGSATLSPKGSRFLESFVLNKDYARTSADRRVEYDSNKLANDLAEEFPYFSLSALALLSKEILSRRMNADESGRV
jgi:hypothetical protein